MHSVVIILLDSIFARHNNKNSSNQNLKLQTTNTGEMRETKLNTVTMSNSTGEVV